MSAEVEFDARKLNKSDAELIQGCRKGDQKSWDALVNRFQRLIITIPRRAGLNEEQAADIFQDVFLTLFQKLDEIENPEKIRSWVVTTAKFKTWAAIRADRGVRALAAPDGEIESQMAAIPDQTALPDDLLIELEEQHLVRTAMKQLEERCQKILSMIYLSDKASSYVEVAAAIGVGETSISPLRTRCLKKLAKLLGF